MADQDPRYENVEVVLVGVGGASCSGKTTLAKRLNRILPDSVIIHQDDFAPPMELVPVHPVHGVQDWDAAPGAISWPRLIDTLEVIKRTGRIPPDHRSHDHLNEQKEIAVDGDVEQNWSTRLKGLQRCIQEKTGRKVIFGLLDGFLLYWHPKVIEQLDVQIMLRVPHDVLKRRRSDRSGYHTAVQSDPEGALWRDPPHYWEDIVYPAYVDAHRDLFVDGDVEDGRLSGEKSAKIVLLETLRMTMSEVVARSCQVVQEFLLTKAVDL